MSFEKINFPAGIRSRLPIPSIQELANDINEEQIVSALRSVIENKNSFRELAS